jgi:casein kinase 1
MLGTVISAVHVYTGASVAVKWDCASKRKPSAVPYERTVYRLLGRQPWLPRVHWSGATEDTQFIVMDRVGATLGALLKACHGKLSLKTVLMLGIRMVSAWRSSRWPEMRLI